MSQPYITNENPDAGHGTPLMYTVGFILSIVLTLLAYFTVVNHVLTRNSMIGLIMVLAIIQLFVQLVFFLHLNRESKPRWNLVAFLFAGMVVLIVVIGSLWIMKNLNYNMTPADINAFMIHDEGVHQ